MNLEIHALRARQRALREKADKIGRVITALETLCEHDFYPPERIGPQEIETCKHCGKEQRL